MRESLEFLIANLEAFVLVIGGTLVLQCLIHYCVVGLRRWWASTEPQPEAEDEDDDNHDLIPDDEDDPSDIDDPTDVWPESPEDLPNEFPDLPEMPAQKHPVPRGIVPSWGPCLYELKRDS